MTLGDKSISSDIQAHRDRLPDVKPKKINLITDALKVELKELINEVLDEREHQKQLNGPYDFFEDDEAENTDWGTY